MRRRLAADFVAAKSGGISSDALWRDCVPWRTASPIEALPRSKAQTRSTAGSVVEVEAGRCGGCSLVGIWNELLRPGRRNQANPDYVARTRKRGRLRYCCVRGHPLA